MQGRAKFGPDVEWLDHADPAAIDYAVNPERGGSFYQAIRRYWPGLPDHTLAADYAGVRPKIAGAEYPDYVLDTSAPGHVMLYGIESPGLTSSIGLFSSTKSGAQASFVKLIPNGIVQLDPHTSIEPRLIEIAQAVLFNINVIVSNTDLNVLINIRLQFNTNTQRDVIPVIICERRDMTANGKAIAAKPFVVKVETQIYLRACTEQMKR